MSLIEWDESFSLRIPEIDAQHKKLIEWISFLDDAVNQGEGGIIVNDIFCSLSRYVLEHFNDEEKLMLRYNFPGYQLHCLEHYFFTKWLMESMATRSDDEALSITTVRFVTDWILLHIQGTDQFYSEFIHLQE